MWGGAEQVLIPLPGQPERLELLKIYPKDVILGDVRRGGIGGRANG